MEQMRCANLSCIKSEEHRGGRYRFVNGKWFCKECAEWAGTGAIMNSGMDLYRFTTTSLTGHPIDVNGKAHLQQLERHFGVSHHQFNNYERNWS